MFSQLLDRAVIQSRKSLARRRGSERKRKELRNQLRVERLEDRRLLAALHWQGDVNTNMSQPGNWADDIAGTDTGAVPVAGDTLVFNTNTVGLASLTAVNDLPIGVNNLTIESVDDTTDNQAFNIEAGPNPLGVVEIRSGGTGGAAVGFPRGIRFQTPVELNANATFVADNSILFDQPISGSFSASASGADEISLLAGPFDGRFIFDGPLELSTTLVAGGGGSLSTTPINVNNAGKLAGFGSFTGPTVVAAGGTISPAFDPPFGVTTGVQSIGDLTILDGGNFDLEIDGINPGFPPGNHDQLVVNGSVSLGNVNYNILPSSTYAPVVGDTFTVIANDDVDPIVVGPGAPAEGTIVGIVNGVPLAISYVGGDGNDVVLTATEYVDIYGYKFEDLNANGIDDAEPRLNGVVFYVDANNNFTLDPGETTAVTGPVDVNNDGNITPDEQGVYNLIVAANVAHQVREVEMGPNAGQTTNDPAPITLGPNDFAIATNLFSDPQDPWTRIDVTELAFGNAFEGSIHGFKFNDLDGGGLFNNDDTPQPGVDFTLTGFDGLGNPVGPITVVTDANGQFAFTNLFPGEYTVTETVPAGQLSTTIPTTRTFTVTSGQELVWQAGAANIPGPAAAVDDQIQNADDNFLTVSEGIPDAQTFVPDVTGELTEVDIRVDALGAGANLTMSIEMVDFFGEPSGAALAVAPAVAVGAGFDQTVTFDFSAATPMLAAGFTYALVLRSDNPLLEVFWQTTTTAPYADGLLYFSLDDGATWTPQPTTDAVFTTRMRPPTDPRVESAALDTTGPGGLLFGNTVPGELHGFKFEDLNGDGVFDAGEPALPGITFELAGTTNNGQVFRQLAVTDATGVFSFTNLFPSQDGVGDGTGYTLTELDPMLPVWYVTTTADIPNPIDVGAGEVFVFPGANIVVNPNQTIQPAIDELQVGNVAPGSIHLLKFEDLDGDGTRDVGEPGLQGVNFRLTDQQNNPIDMDLSGDPIPDFIPTDANGRVNLVNLAPGDYRITEVLPMGFNPTTGPLSRDFTITSGQELVFEAGAADIPARPDPAVDVDITALVTAGTFGVQDGAPRAQTFTPTVTGDLVNLILVVDNRDVVAADLTVEVQTIIENAPLDIFGVPSGDVIATATAQQAASTNGEVTFNFAVPAALIQGNRYAIVVRAPGVTTATLNLPYTNEQYDEGVAFFSTDGGTTWSVQTNGGPVDFLFSTEMQAPADPRDEQPADPQLLFGNVAEASIHGIKFEDLNGDGVYDPGAGDQPIPGVQFVLTGTDSQGNVINAEAFSQLDGQFDFEGLFPSDANGYTVTEVLSDPYQPTTPLTFTTSLFAGQELVWAPGASSVGTFSGDPRVEVVVGQELIFGNVVPGSIHGFKFEDLNNDGQYVSGDGDVPLGGVEFVLTGTTGLGDLVGPIVVTTDAATGQFDFINLLPGIYTVTENNTNPFVTPTTPIERTFFVQSGQEYVWQTGAAGLADRPDPQIDQTQLMVENISIGSISGTVQTAQTFVPGTSGDLTQVDIVVNSQGTPADVTMQLQLVDEFGTPDGTVLATATIPAAEIAIGPDVALSFDFSAASATVFEGTAYALVLSRPTTGGFLDWWVAGPNPYADGTALSSSNAGSTWGDFSEFDHNFTTLVQPFGDPRFETLLDTTGFEGLLYGNTVPGSLHGFKYEDINGNGIYDAVDVPQAGVTFTLSATLADGSEVVRQATTDAAGAFSFLNLPPSVGAVGDATGYLLTENVPFGFISTTGTQSTFDLLSGQEIVWQAGASDVDSQNPLDLREEILETQGHLIFGNVAYGSFHGFKFEDFNGNGIYESPEDFGQAGVTFLLEGTDSFGNVYSAADNTDLFAVSDANGEFWFVDLLPSIAGQPSAIPGVMQTGYTITEIVPTGFAPSTLPISRTLDLESRQEFVWVDGAAMLPAPPVEGIDQSLPVPDGSAPGFLAASGGIVAIQTFTPAVSGTLTNLQIPITTSATVSSDVIVTIHTVNSLGEPTENVLATATIAAANVPTGINQPANFAFALPLVAGQQYAFAINAAAPFGESVSVLNIAGNPYVGGNAFQTNPGFLPGNNLTDIDIAFTTTMLPTADPRVEVLVDSDLNGFGEDLTWGNSVEGSIHGFKFEDINGNGTYEPSFAESGLAGVTFTLVGTDALGRPVEQTTTTNANGEFQFVGLYPSDDNGYLISEMVPTGFIATTATSQAFVINSRQEFVWQFGAAGLDSNDPRFEVLATTNPSGDFGDELIFGNVVPGSIHGFKFLDADADGVFDPATETGLGNIPFQLTGVDSSGQFVDVTVLSGADGEFDFENLLPSVAGQPSAVDGVLQTGYTVSELVPPQFPATTLITFSVDVRSGEEFVAIPGQSTPLFSAPQQDQNQPDGSGGFAASSAGTSQAQQFVPSVTGQLTEVEIVARTIAGISDVVLEIQTVNGLGEPSGEVLATATIPAANVPIGPGQTLTFDFSASLPNLTAGVTYAMVFSSPTSANGLLGLAFSNANPYADGISFQNAAPWAALPDIDLVFTTTMQERLNVEEVVGEVQFIGNTVFGSIHGFKYEDIDGNGIYDDTVDAPLEGVTFLLTATLADGTLISRQATTGIDGEFDFTDLPPSVQGNDLATGYVLTEAFTTGFTPTTATQSFFDLLPGVEFVYAAGASDVDPQDPDDPRVEIVDPFGRLIFGNVAYGSFHGFKFDDFNGDGIYQQPNDFGQAGVTFLLEGTDSFGNVYSAADNTDLVAVTNANGEFWFIDLLPSIAGQPSAIPGVLQTGYTVTELLPTGFVPTTPPLARSFDLESRQEFVWVDGAAMLPPTPVESIDQSLPVPNGSAPGGLAASGGIVAIQTFTPAVSGTLTNLQIPITTSATVSSDVIVTIHTVNSLGEPTENVLATATIAAANVPTGDNQPANFAFTLPLVAGQQYAFAINSATPPGESVSVLGIGGNAYAGGNAFQANPGFLPGNSLVNTDIAFTTTMVATADPRVEVLIDGDQSGYNEELMWGNTLPGAIHGFKFNDLNGNGIVDPINGNIPAEPRMAGFTIQLRDADGNPVTDADGNIIEDQITDANGEYWFTNLLPGTYFVREVQQTGYVQTTHDPQPYTITRGQVYVAQAGLGMLDRDDPRVEIVDKCLIFGNTLLSSIHGYKFNDLNGNGIDDTDPRLAGVTITLVGDSDGDGTPDTLTTTTDAMGQFHFPAIRPGTYTVTETPPTGSVATKSASVTITVEPGEEAVALQGQAGTIGETQFESAPNLDLAFGNAYLGSIHGFKFEDRNGDGDDEFGRDPRLTGVEIILTGDVDGDGDVDTVTTYTGARGEYWFEDLYPGFYTISETIPSGSFNTTATSVDVTIVSGEEAVALRGQSTLMRPLGPGQFESDPNIALAFGNVFVGEIHGHKFADLDGDGIEDTADFRLNGWTIQLTDAQGNPVVDFFGNEVLPVQTADMDLNGDQVISVNERGLYWFENLLPGTYIVTEVDQDGYEQTSHSPQPISITGGQVYVAQRDQAMLESDDAREIIVDKCLAFGNQLRGEINWRKETKNGLLGGVIFTLTQTHSFNLETGLLVDIADRPIRVADNVGPDIDGTFGLFEVIDLPLGRYTLAETFPVPGYDPDEFVEVFNLFPNPELADRFQDATHVWFNTWSKRAFVGSTMAARLDYLLQIGLAETEFNLAQLATEERAGNVNLGAINANPQPFRVDLLVGETENAVQLTHQTSGITVAEGELTSSFDVMTTDLDENVVISSLPRLAGSLRVSVGGGNDVIDLADMNFESLDGGEGYDILRLRELGEIQLRRTGHAINSIEEIELTVGGQRLHLDASLIESLTANSPLKVRHQSGSQLSLDGQWTVGQLIRDGNEIVQVLRSGDASLHVVNPHPWQNVVNRFDVDGSGSVSALDALIGINRLSEGVNGSRLGFNDSLDSYYDVNGDGVLTALDVLQIINQLNVVPTTQGQGEQVAVAILENLEDDFADRIASELVAERISIHAESAVAPPSDFASSVSNAFSSSFDSGEEAESNQEMESTLALLADDFGR